ncbi:MAG TPA: DUF3618 domain-containing protein [Candidatus Dormibacteraeota bacterium]|nr:DUF3618 domain-containing protein [Candidatus Dormibacteraeota bacterium]
MGNQSDEIERHIEAQRSELGENLGELKDKVKNAVDWRAQFEERPLAMMGLAFGGGVLLSALLPSFHRSNGRSNGTLRRAEEGGVGYVAGERRTELMKPKSEAWKKASQTLDGVKGALFAVAATKVTNYLEELVPGFTEQFRKWEGHKSY